jgi:hypothetical protein
MVGAGHGRGMASVNQTRPHCVNQMGKAHSKPLAARHGRGTAWARHAMCESAFMFPIRRVFKLQVWNLGMWASLALAKGRQIMICDLCGGQKAKKERVLTKSEDREWRNFVNLDHRQVSWLSVGW